VLRPGNAGRDSWLPSGPTHQERLAQLGEPQHRQGEGLGLPDQRRRRQLCAQVEVGHLCRSLAASSVGAPSVMVMVRSPPEAQCWSASTAARGSRSARWCSATPGGQRFQNRGACLSERTTMRIDSSFQPDESCITFHRLARTMAHRFRGYGKEATQHLHLRGAYLRRDADTARC